MSPWFVTLAIFVVSFVLTQLLAPKPHIEDARAARMDDLRFPRATSGAPVPYIFGKVRLRSPNVIWYGDFRATPNKKKVKTGLWSSKTYIASYSYSLGMDLALCLGPGVVLRKVYVENKVLFSSAGVSGGSTFTVTQPNFFGGPEQGGGIVGTFAFWSGEFTQAADSYLTGLLTDVPGYVGTCRVVMRGVEIGTNAQLRPMSFEVERYPNNLGLADSKIGDDLNPMEILYDLLTEEWGGGDTDPADVYTASFTAAAATLLAEGNGMSLVFSSANENKSAIAEVLRQVDGILYQDPTTGKTVVKLIRDDYTVGSLPSFDESNVELVEDWSQNDWSETINQVRVTFTERDRAYETSAVLVHDPGNISFQGRVRSTVVAFPGCTEGALATTLAARELSQLSIPLRRATLTVKRDATALLPGSPFRFSWTEFGVVDMVMRAGRFDLGSLVDGRVRVEVLQDRFAAGVPLFSSPETSLWTPPDTTAVDITERNALEVPNYFLRRLDDLGISGDLLPSGISNFAFIMGLARPPAGSTLTAYDFLTSSDAFSTDITYGLTRAPFPESAKLQVKVLAQQGIRAGLMTKMTVYSSYPAAPVFFPSTPSPIRNEGQNLILVDQEIMAFETVTDLGGGVYELGTVHRALLDTQFQDHAADAVIYKLDSPDWITEDYRTDTASLEARYLSITTRDAQDVGDVVSLPLTMNQRYDRPLPPDELLTVSVRAPQEILEQGTIAVNGTARDRDEAVPLPFIVFVNDGAHSAEAGTLYEARLYLNDVLVAQNVNVALPTTLTFGVVSAVTQIAGINGVGQARVELEVSTTTRAAGLESFTPDFVEFWYGNYASLAAELLTNPSFEGVLTGWTTVSGAWATETTAFPLDAFRSVPNYTTHTRHVRSTGSTNELRQDYDYFTPGHAGKAALFSAWKGGKTSATGQLIIEIRDAVSALETVTTPLSSVADLGLWERLEIPLPLRTDGTTVRVRVVAPAADSVWDNISLRVNTVSTSTQPLYSGVTGLTVLAAYGLRKLVSGYGGALVRVRDDFDASEQDVGFDPDGNLEPFFTRGTARVVKLYDQSGNACHLVPVDGAPRLVNMSSETGRPAIEFEANCNLREEAAAATNRPYMTTRPCVLAAIGPKFGTSNTAIFHVPHSDTSHTTPFWRWGMVTGATDWRYQVNGVSHTDVGNGPSNSGKNVLWLDYQNGAFYHNDDATAADTFTAEDITWTVSRLRIGDVPGGTQDWTLGTLHELVIFSDGGISAGSRQTLMEGVADYWFNLAV